MDRTIGKEAWRPGYAVQDSYPGSACTIYGYPGPVLHPTAFFMPHPSHLEGWPNSASVIGLYVGITLGEWADFKTPLTLLPVSDGTYDSILAAADSL
jgi:hypothetical protein